MTQRAVALLFLALPAAIGAAAGLAFFVMTGGAW